MTLLEELKAQLEAEMYAALREYRETRSDAARRACREAFDTWRQLCWVCAAEAASRRAAK